MKLSVLPLTLKTSLLFKLKNLGWQHNDKYPHSEKFQRKTGQALQPSRLHQKEKEGI